MRGFFDLISDKTRNGNWLQGASFLGKGRAEDAADTADSSLRYQSILTAETKTVGQGAPTLAYHFHLDIEHVPETRWAAVLTRYGDPRPADVLAFVLEMHRAAEGSLEVVLGRLHENEEAGKMDDARHVGIGEFDASLGVKCVHGKVTVPRVDDRGCQGPPTEVALTGATS